MRRRVIIPPPVCSGDKIALLAPASIVNPRIVEGLLDALKTASGDFSTSEIVVYPSACEAGYSGSYAASEEQRLADFRDAWSRDDIRLVVCARGGYGCVHLLEALPLDFIRSNPKWLVGFSDVSALHALLSKAGIASIHGGMAKQLVENTDAGYGPYRLLLKHIVDEPLPMVRYKTSPHELNILGSGKGVLIGGNLAVLNGLAATRYDMLQSALRKDAILFIEDISEPIYAVERMLFRLHLQGVLKAAKGIIIGQFTDYKPDRNYPTMYYMISDRFRRWGISCPVAFDFPVGHSDRNVPLIESAEASLTVTSQGAELVNGCLSEY